jgi:glutathione S-transferase/GST-like protein
MLDVYTWEPNANSGKPLFSLHEKGIPFTYHYIDMGAHEHHAPGFLAINPDGTIPAIIHDGFTMTESTPAMEYIDEAFDGPSLRPADPYHRWRMRMLLRYMDNVVAPALAMIASNRLAAPRFVEQDPDHLRAALGRIPLPERRATWEKLMFQATPPADIAESERRVGDAIRRFDGILGRRPWIAGDSFSLADIGVFATFYSLPLAREDEVNDEATPHLMRWLRTCHARPGLQAALRMCKAFVTQRAAEIREKLGVAGLAAA